MSEAVKAVVKRRVPVGIWAQWPKGARWSNEGMTRLLGLLIEGIAASDHYIFRVILPDWIRDEAEEDFRTLSATIDVDFTLHSPSSHGVRVDSMEELADFANDYMDVAGWISLFPSFNLVTRLHKPVAVIFPDAIPKIFHEFSDLAWGYNGNHAVWEGYVREVVTKADRLITFSEHVRDGQLGPLFGVSADKVRVVPHAPPDLAGSLPFKEPSRRTRASLGLAAELLREHAAERGWEYLRNFPFDQVPYMAVSTQDRVTKNIRLILDAVLRLVRQQRVDLKILSTSPLHFGADWTVLPGAIERAQAHRDLVSVPDLPKEQHAALFHCAAVAIHASIFEGGHAPFPFYEALSVGTPCLMARGPHVEELLAEEPGLAEFVFDPNDAGGLGALIVKTIDARERSFAVQYEIYQRLRKRTWTDVAVAYAEAATAHLQ